jgi:chromosome segregation ATPase
MGKKTTRRRRCRVDKLKRYHTTGGSTASKYGAFVRYEDVQQLEAELAKAREQRDHWRKECSDIQEIARIKKEELHAELAKAREQEQQHEAIIQDLIADLKNTRAELAKAREKLGWWMGDCERMEGIIDATKGALAIDMSDEELPKRANDIMNDRLTSRRELRKTEADLTKAAEEVTRTRKHNERLQRQLYEWEKDHYDDVSAGVDEEKENR